MQNYDIYLKYLNFFFNTSVLYFTITYKIWVIFVSTPQISCSKVILVTLKTYKYIKNVIVFC